MPLTKIADLGQPQEQLDPLLQLAASLSSLYDQFLSFDEGDGHLREPGIHASELGCERKVLYSLLGAKKNLRVPKKWKQRFEHGHALHKMLQKQFQLMATRSGGLFTFEAEVPIHPKYQEVAKELNLKSSCDGVFTFHSGVVGTSPPTHAPVLRSGLEIKTESPDGWEGLKEPRPEHVEQAHLYMKALDLPVFWFLYFNKGNQNNTNSYAPWLIAFDEEVWQRIESKCRRILKLAEEYRPGMSKLPDRTEKVWCEFCPYRGADLCNPEWLQRKRSRVYDPRSLKS